MVSLFSVSTATARLAIFRSASVRPKDLFDLTSTTIACSNSLFRERDAH